MKTYFIYKCDVQALRQVVTCFTEAPLTLFGKGSGSGPMRMCKYLLTIKAQNLMKYTKHMRENTNQVVTNIVIIGKFLPKFNTSR